MNFPANQNRIQRIFQMLFELATGNFTHRILDDQMEDEISTISKSLNKVAENMLTLLIRLGYVMPVYTYQSLVQVTFILSKEFQIESYNNNIREMLGYPPETLYKYPFKQIIAPNSKEIVSQIHASVNQEADYYTTSYVSFKVTNGGIHSHFCSFSKLLHSDKIIVTIIATLQHDFIYYTQPTALAGRSKDADVIQQLHHYILAHLDAPLPTIKELAKLFGSNTFTLKNGFRNYFNTSIYHFYNEQRLKKAQDLLQQTAYSIKEIGYMTGFKDYPTFYRAFKKQYGCAPSDLFREKKHENNQ